jgi:hypothetical protein
MTDFDTWHDNNEAWRTNDTYTAQHWVESLHPGQSTVHINAYTPFSCPGEQNHLNLLGGVTRIQLFPCFSADLHDVH